jgi:hypothetical protein
METRTKDDKPSAVLTDDSVDTAFIAGLGDRVRDARLGAACRAKCWRRVRTSLNAIWLR